MRSKKNELKKQGRKSGISEKNLREELENSLLSR